VVAELSGHTDTVEHVKFSFDGKLLATGGLDGTVRIWKVEDASLLHVLEGPTEVTWIDWHPKGDVLIAGSADGTVWMWNALLGQCMQVFSGGCPTSTCGLFSPDGKFLVTGGVGNITVWNPKDGTASITYTGNLPEVDALSIAIHPVMSVALVGFADGRLVVAHLGYHQILATHSTGEDAIEWVGYMKGHSIMMAATLGGSIHMIEAGNYRTRGVLSSEGIDGITSGTWLNKEGYLAVGCLNGTIAILDGRKGEKMALFPMGVEEDAVSENAVFDLVEIPHLDLLLASFDDGRVRIFRI
jgi:WD40 repeat protein